MKKQVAFFFALLLQASLLTAQSSKSQVIGFYNLENLFDIIDDEGVRDGEYTPTGKKQWTAERYANKLQNMSFVLNELGVEYQKKGAAIIGVCEVENRGVLEDLVAHENLKKKKWAIIHGDSPDKRGIDVAMLYNPKLFEPLLHKYVNPKVTREGEEVFTRDILLVTGILKGKDTIHVLVNHWPSRWGGEEKSRPGRIQAAKMNKHLMDSIRMKDANARIIVMGDLNDDPTNVSVKDELKSQAELANTKEGEMYNPFENILAGDEGSLKYRGEWNLFDQILISPSVATSGMFRFVKAEVYNRCYLIQQKGKYSGNPHRTFGGKKYLNGYSDHLPTMIVLDVN